MAPETGPDGIIHISNETPWRELEQKEIQLKELQNDLQTNYTDHLKTIEDANLDMVQSVVKNAQQGFIISLILNISSFMLGAAIIIIGLILLVRSPETLGRTVGIISSLTGTALLVTLLFWRGPLERILKSASNLAQINAISLGLAHRLNQVSRVFVRKTIDGEIDIDGLSQLNDLIGYSVEESVQMLLKILPEETSEEIVQKLVTDKVNSISDNIQDNL